MVADGLQAAQVVGDRRPKSVPHVGCFLKRSLALRDAGCYLFDLGGNRTVKREFRILIPC